MSDCTDQEAWLQQHALGVLAADHSHVVHQRNQLLAAAKNLRDVKGRFHTEQAYKELMQVVNSIKG